MYLSMCVRTYIHVCMYVRMSYVRTYLGRCMYVYTYVCIMLLFIIALEDAPAVPKGSALGDLA